MRICAQKVACPKCKKILNCLIARSGNTFFSFYFTDGSSQHFMLLIYPIIQKCKHCNKLSWSQEFITIEPYYESILSKDEKLPAFSRIIPTSDYYEALTTLVQTNDEEKKIRENIFWQLNAPILMQDKKLFGCIRERLAETIKVDTTSKFGPYSKFKNMIRLFHLLNENEESERIMKAEIMRECGRFDIARSFLYYPFSKQNKDLVCFIFSLISHYKTKVALIPALPDLHRKFDEYRTDPRRYIHRIFRGKSCKELLKKKDLEITEAIICKIKKENAERVQRYQDQIHDEYKGPEI